MSSFKPVHKQLLALLALAVLASGCALEPTPYQPADQTRYGYSEQRLENDRYRVQFSGNEATPRATVQDYLLFRAAELTLSDNRTHFRFLEQSVEEHRREETVLVSAGNGLYHYPLVFGTSVIQGFVSSRFDAVAQFRTLVGDPRDGDPNVFNAAEVKRNLGPSLRLPEHPKNPSGKHLDAADSQASRPPGRY